MSSAALQVDLISSVPPAPETGGGLVLHRHLYESPRIRCTFLGGDPRSRSTLAPRLVERLQKTRLFRVSEAFWVWKNGRWLDARMRNNPAPGDVVVTVAHGDACWSALRYARERRRPLITFFHDWSPDVSHAPRILHATIARRFHQIYERTDVALCVSEGMQAALGPHPHSIVLLPIPGVPNVPAAPTPTKQPHLFRVLYAGNLIEYAPMLAQAIDAARKQSGVALQVRGNNPEWPAAFCARARQGGQWVEAVPRVELETWLASADAFLVPMAFDTRLRRRMETSFPSKLTEFAQYGKPLVIWGPASSSAQRWADAGRRACCVTSPNPHDFWRALEELAGSESEQHRLAAAARAAASTEFQPRALQNQFEAALHAAAQRRMLQPNFSAGPLAAR